MKLLLFGATGMVGQGVLRECLLDPTVEGIVTVGRTATGVQHPKLQEIVRQDLWNYTDYRPCPVRLSSVLLLPRRVVRRNDGTGL